MNEFFKSYLDKPVARGSLLRRVGLASAGALALGSAGILTQNKAFADGGSESVRDILNVAATAEALAVTVLYGAVSNADKLGLRRHLGTVGSVLDVVEAAMCEEQYHLDFLQSAGATPLLTTFSLPDPAILTDYNTFFQTIEAAEGIFIAAYMAATVEFANGGNGTLARYAYQIGGVECEHRVAARAALGEQPVNNKAFETPMFSAVSDAAALLGKLGFLSPTAGNSYPYPGAAAGHSGCSVGGGVTQTTP